MAAETTKKPAAKKSTKKAAAKKPAVFARATDPDTSPTAHARTMIAKGASDDTILAATKERFGPQSKTPVLFTRADLGRLRVRLKNAVKNAEAKARKATADAERKAQRAEKATTKKEKDAAAAE